MRRGTGGGTIGVGVDKGLVITLALRIGVQILKLSLGGRRMGLLFVRCPRLLLRWSSQACIWYLRVQTFLCLERHGVQTPFYEG